MGRRESETQGGLCLATQDVARSPGHVFYERLNWLLGEAGFDAYVEELCEPYYAHDGRPGIPPGTYISMLFVCFFEGIDSQRGIAWRCKDSLSLREFLGLKLTDNVPDHSSLTRIRDRLPIDVVQQVFVFVLKMAAEQKLISGTQVGVNATLLEANAAMKAIVRRDTVEDWKQYVVRLMKEEGVIEDEAEQTDNEVRKFDKKRSGKKVSNKDWKSPADEDARILKMKDGRTHLDYKAEHTVDMDLAKYSVRNDLSKLAQCKTPLVRLLEQGARQVAYLKEENRILRARLPERIVTTDQERKRLMRAGRKLGNQLKDLMSIVTYQTFRRWIREIEAEREIAVEEKSSTVQMTKTNGRPKTSAEVPQLIVQIRLETGYGYTKIRQELAKLGIKVSRQTVKNVLVETGLHKDPNTGKDCWDAFLKRHADTLWQCDYLTKPMWTSKGIIDLFMIVFIHIPKAASFRIDLSNPASASIFLSRAFYFTDS